MITLHALPPSHPCMTAEAALRPKGVDYERVDLPVGPHVEQMAAIYGEGNTTVPGALFDGRPVHTSRAILAHLDALAPDPPLYPSDAVREAERWGDVELQDLGRRLPFGALHFRPESMGSFGGGGPLDPAGTDFAMRYVRTAWRYHGITCERLAADLAGLPGKLAHVEGLLADGVLGGDTPNAADLQIAATLRVLLPIADLRPLLAPVEGYARGLFTDYAGDIPAGAYPAGWVPPA
jgi:glutathione S-transferase